MKLPVLVAFVLSVVQLAVAQDYEIRLHRPEAVGDKTRVVASATDSQKVSQWSGTTKVQEDGKEVAISFEAVSTVRSISPKGKPKSLSLSVEKLILKEEGSQKELLPKGTEVKASVALRKTQFEINGQPASAEVAEALGTVVTLSTQDHTDDELFGTTERKRVGNSWKINSPLFAEMLTMPGMEMKDVTGKGALNKVLQEPNGTRLLVSVEATGQAAVQAGQKGLPPGTMTFKGTAELPTDPKLPRTAETSDMSYSARVKRAMPNGQDSEMRIDMKRTVAVKLTPVK
jgi:hypothetical protein